MKESEAESLLAALWEKPKWGQPALSDSACCLALDLSVFCALVFFLPE